MRSRTLVLGTLGVLLGAPTAATASVEHHSIGGVGPSGGSWVEVAVADVAGLDRIEVWAGTAGSGANVTPGASRTCVSAQRSERRTEERGGSTHEVRVVRTEAGCTTPTAYSFDRVTWRAATTAQVPTTVTTEVHERVGAGWHLVEDRHEASVATIDLTWQGTAVDELGPWVDPPGVCYTDPPSLCHFGAGADVGREALVEGSVSLGGLSADVELSAPGAPGAMRWWLAAWVVAVP